MLLRPPVVLLRTKITVGPQPVHYRLAGRRNYRNRLERPMYRPYSPYPLPRVAVPRSISSDVLANARSMRLEGMLDHRIGMFLWLSWRSDQAHRSSDPNWISRAQLKMLPRPRTTLKGVSL